MWSRLEGIELSINLRLIREVMRILLEIDMGWSNYVNRRRCLKGLAPFVRVIILINGSGNDYINGHLAAI